MPSTLPKRVDPWQLCSKDRRFSGDFSIDRFKRLAPLLCSSEGRGTFDLLFTRDDDKRDIVSGSISATIDVTCQRCLQPMAFPIVADFVLGLVTGLDEAALLAEDLDPLWLESGELDVADILEDELILAVPVAPRHRQDECQIAIATGEQASAKLTVERERPFALLGSLLDKT